MVLHGCVHSYISSISSNFFNCYIVSVNKPNLCGSVALSCPEKENKNDQKCKKKKKKLLYLQRLKRFRQKLESREIKCENGRSLYSTERTGEIQAIERTVGYLNITFAMNGSQINIRQQLDRQAAGREN